MRKNSARVACLSFAVVLFSAQLQAETLLEIYDLAISNAPQLKAAEATYKIGREALPQARAALLPSITGSVGIQEGQGYSTTPACSVPTFWPSRSAIITTQRKPIACP